MWVEMESTTVNTDEFMAESIRSASRAPRLFILEMVMKNFKSYAGEQRVGPFHKSFSAVVGLNGSRKSNVIDAMLFVFGKRAKQMRLNKVSELIHNSTNHQNLGLGNPLKALSTAKSLLRLPECSRIYVFLGIMYVAEALCLLNKLKEASDYLKAYLSAGNNVKLPYSQEDCEKLTVEKDLDNEDSNGGSGAPNTGSSGSDSKLYVFSSPEEARGIFCANVAVNCALMGDFERAQHFVMKALSETPNATQAIVTAIYVDLKCGKRQEALAKLKQHRGIRFLPWGLKLNGSS